MDIKKERTFNEHAGGDCKMFFLEAVAKRITDWLVKGGSITEEDREVYEFGLDNLLSTLTNFIIIMCIGLLLGIIVESVIFYMTYLLLRIYAGGYHADKPLTCFFISIIILIPFLLAIRSQQMWNVQEVSFLVLIVSVIVLVLITPVGNKNKMLDDLEKVVYRRRLLRNLAIASVAMVILFVLSLHQYSAAVLCGILLSMFIAVAGKIKLALEK